MKILLLAVSLLFIQCTQAQYNFNGDFEIQNPQSGKPSGWLFAFNPAQEKAYPVSLDSTTIQNGKFSVRIEKVGKEADFGVLDFPIQQLFEGNSITLKGYIKTQDVQSGYAGLWMRLDKSTGEMLAFDNMQNRGVKRTSGWKEFSITLPYDGEKVGVVHVGGLLTGDGKAWFDHLEVLMNGKPLSQTKFRERVVSKAESDTSFKFSSGIKDIQLNPRQIINLTVTGQFWSFLKYHHLSIAKGNYNWDAELFRLLPDVLAVKDAKMLSNTLEQFLDKMPKPELCKTCGKIESEKYEIKPDYGVLLNRTVLSSSLTDKLNYIKNNRNIGPNYYVGMAGAGNPDFKNEKRYAAMIYPDAGYRILALYRYWAMINYFFPYRDIIGTDWNQVMSSSLPDFVNAKNSLDYSLAALKLISKVKDTHANIYGANQALNDFKGKYAVPFQAQFVEKRLVITALHTDTLDVKGKLAVGDIITAINSVPVDELVKKYLPYTAASNEDTQLRNLPRDFLLRSNADKIQLNIERNGKFFDYWVPMGNLMLAYKDVLFDRSEAFKVLDSIGYIFPAKYKNNMLSEIKKSFKKVKGIVVDMRCYPSDFMPFTFGSYIKDKQSAFVKFTNGTVGYPGAFRFGAPIENGGPMYGNSDYYNSIFQGKIVVIVNSSTQSQAEYTTMAFQSAPNVTVIGSTTAGADGNVSPIFLPGGLYTMISGIGVFYPDGKPSQRIGVKVDYTIYPTLKGIAAGRDELMEKALEILNKP